MKMFRTISAVVLALLVLVSSTSFMVGWHVCMGEVQHVALFSKAEGCAMEQSLPPCHRHMKAPCCEDKTVIHNADDFKPSLSNIHILAPASIDIEQPLTLISEVIPASFTSRIQYYYYDPPLPSADITVEQRVFLI